VWLIRHAIVEENARAILYGRMDVALCPEGLVRHAEVYRSLAARLPRPATWIATPLSRTTRTARQIFAAGYPETPLRLEPALIEQDLGEWQGLVHAALPSRLRHGPHPFWPLTGGEHPPGGESMNHVIARVGPAMERLAWSESGGDVVVVSHGGAIRAAIAHALGVAADPVLHLSIANLGLTRLDREAEGWRVVCINEAAGM
jgi:broad specificity phosphatase PhoE